MPISPPSITAIWRQRAERCAVLAEDFEASRDVLRFYEQVLRFQAETARRATGKFSAGPSLREQVDVAFTAEALLPELLQLAETSGPKALAAEARKLRAASKESHRDLLLSAMASEIRFEPQTFFARACLQPLAEALQMQMGELPHAPTGSCPACGGLPQLAVLRSVGEGAERSLLCSFCLREWVYRRVICPFCQETDQDKLPRFSTEEFSYIGVHACDTCRHYLKAVDLSLDGRAVPLVDEVAAAALDVWAGAQGYLKIVPNLMGF